MFGDLVVKKNRENNIFSKEIYGFYLFEKKLTLNIIFEFNIKNLII